MTTVERILPGAGSIAIEALVRALALAPRARPFSAASIDFVAALAEALMTDPAARRHPELMSLGFFLRRAELTTMARELATASRDAVRMPIGLVFHVPPSNVDTVFAYSWLLSLLAGNRDVVRLSSRPSPVVDITLGHAARLLADPAHAAVAARTAIVRYGHDAAINRALSAACDLRVIWGGDAAIRALREAPLAPHGRDLTFPDRQSFAVLRADAIVDATADAVAAVAGGLVNDLFWFDQAACASPRLVVWVGSPGAARAASVRLFGRVGEIAEQRGHRLEPAHVMNKVVFTYRAVADHPAVVRREQFGSLTVVEVEGLAAVPHDHPGAGYVWSTTVEALAELTAFVGRKHQTLVHFGFTRVELDAVIDALAGRGVDRVVPIGRALAFDRMWDGHDLIAAFTRIVHVEAGKG
ncbi:MAG: gamma-glutamyl phosphate reductase [Deltaproteobacteria bacterium]|nr:gamma-glutamyl phosphate reductase [Deltaproteobacteria bacterium]